MELSFHAKRPEGMEAWQLEPSRGPQDHAPP